MFSLESGSFWDFAGWYATFCVAGSVCGAKTKGARPRPSTPFVQQFCFVADSPHHRNIC